MTDITLTIDGKVIPVGRVNITVSTLPGTVDIEIEEEPPKVGFMDRRRAEKAERVAERKEVETFLTDLRKSKEK